MSKFLSLSTLQLKRAAVLSFMLIGSAALLSSCATTPSSFAELGKYDQFKLNTNIFRVTYQARNESTAARAEEIALLKAAQVTVQNGYRYFEITDKLLPSDQPNVIVAANPMFNYYGSFGYYGGYGRYPFRHSIGYIGYDYPLYPQAYYGVPQKVIVSYTIHCSNTAKPDENGQYDATIILTSLGPRYGLNPDGSPILPPPPSASLKTAS
ncbi:CC0125/CC1285 family lipoprotein [Aquirhabdus parva]|uniref:DUF4136 domain-containing protein n=1 Tax=Aquirhabdus parva TaxID=2283318 RepID=A0A345PAC3_9GAMM|nr:hypothetical protein [Aquirhabdus parva]AXI04232.1 hypothetical protein HYN46_16150 [Aquirhabdus parva]